jgi:hypothetical protein
MRGRALDRAQTDRRQSARYAPITEHNPTFSLSAMKCNQCYDFCLPEYGAETDRVGNFNYLNVLRRDCFYLFVPEWRKFAQAYNQQQNQHDFEQFYINQRAVQPAVQPSIESKWISVQNPNNQQMRNVPGMPNGNAMQNLALPPGFNQPANGFQQGNGQMNFQQANSNGAFQQNQVLPQGFNQMPVETGGARNGRYQPSTTGAPQQPFNYPPPQQSVPNWQQNNNALNSNAIPINNYNNGQGWIRVGSGR